MEKPTLKDAFQYLFDMLRWRLSKKIYTGKMIRYKGKRCRITGETYRNFYIGAHVFPKVDYPNIGFNLQTIKK